jgi:hypothetical protein
VAAREIIAPDLVRWDSVSEMRESLRRRASRVVELPSAGGASELVTTEVNDYTLVIPFDSSVSGVQMAMPLGPEPGGGLMDSPAERLDLRTGRSARRWRRRPPRAT